MSEEWTAQQCAKEWGVKLKTWHGYVARGQAPQPKRRVGRTPVWDADKVRTWPRGDRTWNFMQVELVPDDRLIKPMIGQGGLSREQAHAGVQSILDRGAEANAAVFSGAAATWRRGAKDDTVMAGPFVWTIYAYAAGEDPRRSAIAWLDDFAATMRTTGLDVQVGQLPD